MGYNEEERMEKKKIDLNIYLFFLLYLRLFVLLIQFIIVITVVLFL